MTIDQAAIVIGVLGLIVGLGPSATSCGAATRAVIFDRGTPYRSGPFLGWRKIRGLINIRALSCNYQAGENRKTHPTHVLLL